MKITLLTNSSGEIIGAGYLPRMHGESNHITTEIRPSTEQRVHEVEVPAELHAHVLEGTLAQEIFKFRVEGTGKKAKLVKRSVKARK